VIAGLGVAALAVVAVILWSVIPGSTKPGNTPTPVSNPVLPGMIPIQGKTFTMGRNDGNEFEGPAHLQKVDAFLIDEAEVTNDQYQQFVDVTGHQAPSHWSQRRYANGEASLPVVHVTWFDAKEYCESLSKRLPSEEEWEFAARGTTGWHYPYGNEWKPNYSAAQSPDEPRISSKPVRSYPDGRSPFGLYDMAGNVLEWTSSDFKVYPGGKVKEDDVKANTGRKVTRGGAFVTSAKYQTVTDRFFYIPSSQNDFIGFRCAKDVQQPSNHPSPDRLFDIDEFQIPPTRSPSHRCLSVNGICSA
jgi:serine/threonine-protein kinase